MMTVPESKHLDFRVIFETPLRQFVPWLFMVLLVSVAGYPGVVCVTPMAWLLALRVGNLCTARSRSPKSTQRVMEATMAGGFLGFLQGVLFLVIVPFIGPYRSDEITKTIALTLIMILVGIFAGAALSFFTAYWTEQRHRRT